MNTEEFEDILRQQPMNGPPPQWRREILAKAPRSPRSASARASWQAGRHLLQNRLWPHPFAWGALAACWIVILALNNAATPSPAEADSARIGAAIGQASLYLARNLAELGLTQEPELHQPPSHNKPKTPESGWSPPAATLTTRLARLHHMHQNACACGLWEDRAQTGDNDSHAGKQSLIPSPQTVTVGRSVIGRSFALPTSALQTNQAAKYAGWHDHHTPTPTAILV